jgi:Domain of unknown function (DUF5615)
LKPTLYLDEDVNPRLVELLSAAGDDATSARDAGALGETDPQQFVRAKADGRVIFTYNYLDFDVIARQEAEAGRTHPGIVVSYHQYAGDELGELAATLIAFLAEREADVFANTYLVLPRARR